MSPSFSIFSRSSNAQFASLQLLIPLPSRDLSLQSLTNCPPHNLFLLTSLQMPGWCRGRIHEFLKYYFNCGRISARLNHLQRAGREIPLPQPSTFNLQPSGRRALELGSHRRQERIPFPVPTEALDGYGGALYFDDIKRIEFAATPR